MMKTKLNNIRKVQWADEKAIIYSLLAFAPALIIRRLNPNIWIMCERMNHAEDNGWIFFNWLKIHHKSQQAYFVLDKSAFNFNKDDRRLIAWGSLRHYIYFFAAKIWIMATFQTPSPNPRVCSRIFSLFHNTETKIYLRHGISKDGMEEHCYAIHHFRLFICGAKPEYDYVKRAGGYPEENVKYTGFARFDDLLETKSDKHFILIIPTWRKYIGVDHNKSQSENESAFIQSDFYNNYIGLIHNKRLIDFLCENKLKARFCLHAEYRRFQKFFTSGNNCIDIVKDEESIHDLLKSTSLLITDYSSVFFDAAYVGKPIIYYHFDYDEFRKNHLKEGYFSYENDGMGPIVKSADALVDAIINLWDRDYFQVGKSYQDRAARFFPLRDTQNCERIYLEIMKV